MTKAELINEIALSSGYDKKTVSVITESLMKNIKKSLGRGEFVYLRGFGSFVIKPRKEKMARNILARTSVFVPAHCVPDFQPSQEMQDCVYKVKLQPKTKEK